MALFKYFNPVQRASANACEQAGAVLATHGRKDPEILKVREELLNINDGDIKRKRTGYTEEEKVKVARYAHIYGNRPAVTKFKKELSKLDERSVRRWVVRYKSQLRENPEMKNVSIGVQRGRPTLLSTELDEKLIRMLANLRKGGASVNIHVVRGVLAGLVRSDVSKYGQYLDFNVTKAWVRSLYKRMKWSRRTCTTSRPNVTRALWIEIRAQFLHGIADIVRTFEIPDELIINLDQTPSKYVPASNITMTEKGAKHIAIAGGNDKRTVTLTVAETLSGCILPFQVIYTGTTNRCVPADALEDPDFVCSYNKSHWSNEEETLRVVDRILAPHIKKVKEDLGLPSSQKSLIIWDAFTGQNTDAVNNRLEKLDIASMQVPKNMTHLLQPLDLTTNGKIKSLERGEFSSYFTSAIMKEMLNDPTKDVTTVKVDLRLSVLKPLHFQTLKKVMAFLRSDDGKAVIKSGFRVAGIENAVQRAREGELESLDPFE